MSEKETMFADDSENPKSTKSLKKGEPYDPKDHVDYEPPPTSAQNRISIVEQVYYQSGQDDPTVIESRTSQVVLSDEQIYERRNQKATENEKVLEFGWVEEVGMILIANNAGKFLSVLPTEEQKTEIASQILEVGYQSREGDPTIPFAKILPGQSLRWCPYSPQNLYVRAQSGEVPYTLYAFPR